MDQEEVLVLLIRGGLIYVREGEKWSRRMQSVQAYA